MIEVTLNNGLACGVPAGNPRTGQGPEHRQCQSCRRLNNPRLLDSISCHFRLIFGEDTAPARVYLADEFLLIRTGKLLGMAERNLLEAGTEGGSDLIRTMKLKLAGNTLAVLASIIAEETGLSFRESFLSYSPIDDEMMVLLNIHAEAGVEAGKDEAGR